MQINSPKQFKLSELVNGLDVTIKGDKDCLITGVSSIEQAQLGHITFLNNPLYKKYLSETNASVIILAEEFANDCRTTAVISRNPYYIYAKVAAYFVQETAITPQVHASAVVGQHCEIDPSAYIGPNCVLGKHVKIAANVKVSPGCIIGDFCEIGEGTELDAKVTLYSRTKIGKRSHLLSGCIIGSDGFGFANHKGAWHKIPQLGAVEIGDDVSIGANTTIDRGAIENTVIENGVKLDNLIQVGHNVQIGENTIIAGCVAIAGSTVIGKNCMIGGASCLAGHITINDGVMVTGMTAVTKSIREPGIYSSGIVGAVPNHEFRKNNARFHRLENLMQRIKTLESALKELNERNDL